MESPLQDMYANTIFSENGENERILTTDNFSNMEDHAYNNYASNNYSRQDSVNSSNSSSFCPATPARYTTTDRLDNLSSDGASTEDSSSLVLKGGKQLLEESRTDINHSSTIYDNTLRGSDQGNTAPPAVPARPLALMSSSVLSVSNGTGTAKMRAAKSPFTSPPLESIPVEEVTIPSDANISTFTCDQLANFLQCLKVEDRIISHLHRKQVDGKRFSRLKDSELENLGMKNAVVLFFRDKSSVRSARKKNHFIL